MLIVRNNTPAYVPFVFEQHGEIITPDTGSARYSLYNHAGAIVPAYSNVALNLGANVTEVAVAVPQDQNIISGDFEKRSVILRYSYNGKWYEEKKDYVILPFRNYSVTAQSVRNYIGATHIELPDEDVDMEYAYYMTKKDLGIVDIDSFLTGTDYEKFLKANQAIVLRSVIHIANSLPMKLPEKETKDTVSYQRFKNFDFDAMKDRAQKEYRTHINDLLAAERIPYAIALAATGTDPITGA